MTVDVQQVDSLARPNDRMLRTSPWASGLEQAGYCARCGFALRTPRLRPPTSTHPNLQDLI